MLHKIVQFITLYGYACTRGIKSIAYFKTVWVKIEGANSAHIRASLETENELYDCVGSVTAKQGCWSFLKGGFVLDSSSNLSLLFFQVKYIRLNITLL